MHFAETHPFNDSRVVRGEEGFDLKAGLFGHVLEDGLPVRLEVLRRFGRDNAEIQFFQFLRSYGRQPKQRRCDQSGQ